MNPIFADFKIKANIKLGLNGYIGIKKGNTCLRLLRLLRL